MKVLVTGGSGLVGSHVARHLATEHEVANLDLVDQRHPSVDYISGDILDVDLLAGILPGYDAVVHCAAVVAPTDRSAAEITKVNVLGTKRLLSACEGTGIKRFVFISSDSVYGFVFSEDEPRPLYLPVDELHPLRALEPYGASKLLGEELVRSFSARTDATAVALRPPWVWCPEEYERCRELVAAPDMWRKGLWAYVHVDDLAEAVTLSLKSKFDRPFEIMHVAAADIGTEIPTPKLVAKYYPDTQILPEELGEFQSLMSIEKAKDLIGFVPELSWRDFL